MASREKQAFWSGVIWGIGTVAASFAALVVIIYCIVQVAVALK